MTRGHAHHPPQVLLQPWRVVTVQQYCLPGGQEEISRTILELEKVHIVRPTHSPFNSPVWPVKKPDGTWRMTVDYRKLNKVTPPLHMAVLSIHDLMDCLTIRLGTYHYIVDLVNTFFSIDTAPECQEQFAFTWDGRQWTFQVLLQGYLHSPTICHGLIAQDLAQWDHLSSVALFHYVDDILLTSDSFSDLEQAAPSLLRHLKSHGWVVNEGKVQGPGLSIKFLGVVWSGKGHT
ncbi:hypothetical protein mRhiFer1_009123 [Rhinolophus ferrumequinum]|uniref:Reverse transcriptase domain-containing protein n=1 Tax=Rhinolophus ferrumequinum TaxID=59479 RepID=A0A7J7SIZ5_RHIFE|nr:hypothetical protein mRhiFer1_009123 [Rhinolophus ferrumequinum]